MTVREFLSRLEGVRKAGEGWLAFCPAHDDRNKPGLSVASRGGKILLHCFNGCAYRAVLDALKVAPSELFEDGSTPPPRPAAAERKIVQTYDYVDEMGALLYQVVRYDPKDFRQRRPEGDGWAWRLGDVRRVIYRMTDLLEHERVFWCEGEKDVDSLWACGVPATTSMGGADGFREEYARQLLDVGVREVVVLPDHDESGEKYASIAASAFLAAGLRVKIVRLPGLLVKGDVTDWLAGGGTPERLTVLTESVPWLGGQQPDANAPVPLAVVVDGVLEALERGAVPGVVPTPYSELNEYLDGGFRPGELVYVGAWPGVGKTVLGLEFVRWAAKEGTGVMVVSREMVNAALARRLIAQHVRINAKRLRRHALMDAEWTLLRAAVPSLKALPIWMADKLTTVDEVSKVVRGFADQPPLGLVVVDYLQLLRTDAGARDAREQVEAVSFGLKTLAVERNVPIVCLSALSRRPKDAPNRRPTMADLRESGKLEHDADIIILLHRVQPEAETEVHISKNRDGETGMAWLSFRAEHMAFEQGMAPQGEHRR